MPDPSPPLADETLFKPASDLVVRKVGDEAILVPVRNRVGDLESIFTLNESALRIWGLLDGKTPLSDLVETICAEYDVSADIATNDTLELIGTLREAGLIESVPGASS